MEEALVFWKGTERKEYYLSMFLEKNTSKVL
jgi:hypothetical protein